MSGGITESWVLSDLDEMLVESFWSSLSHSFNMGSIGVCDGVWLLIILLEIII